MQYGLNLPAALIDSTVYSLLLLLGFMLLENVFRFYLPTKSNVFLVFFLPFILSLIVLYAGNLFFTWVVPDSLKDLSFINNSFLARLQNL
jgi:hypothetical protein